MFSLLEMLSYRCVRHYLSFAIVLGHIYIELNNVAETLTNIICLKWVFLGIHIFIFNFLYVLSAILEE